MNSYQDAVKTEGIVELTDLQSLLWHIYYDEAEHLEKLSVLKYAIEAGADLMEY